MSVAALFVRKDTVYRELGAECFDIERDARTFDLAGPVVAHPPCRAWGKLKGLARPRPDERDLAWWAVHVVRLCGGVLEHPIHSSLWRELGCGTPGLRDGFGGVLLHVDQSWYGHPCSKPTGLYVVGPVPELRASGPAPTHAIGGKGLAVDGLRAAHSAMREHTPRAFAELLLSIAGGVAL